MGHIADVNGTYDFTYNTDTIPHLTTITSTYPGANYTFTYGSSITLCSPISGTQCGSAQMLASATNNNSQMTTSSYGVLR